jgi:hypothetical protein
MKKYEVLVAFNTEGRDVRVRSDIDKHGGFTRVNFPGTREKFVIHTDLDNGNKRAFIVAFEGSFVDAKRFAELIKLGYDGIGVERSIFCQTTPVEG